MKSHYQIAIIGAGTAGIMTAAQLLKKTSHLTLLLLIRQINIITSLRGHWSEQELMISTKRQNLLEI